MRLERQYSVVIFDIAIGLAWKMKDTKNKNKGRPVKKPGYNEEIIMRELLDAISDYYLTGGMRRARLPKPVSLRQVACEFDITLIKARKLLITAGAYHTEISEEVQALKASGKSVEQIMELTGLKRSSVHSYLPYTKSIYNLQELSLDAERCRVYRERKKAVAAMAECKDCEELEEKLWEAIRLFEGYRFITVKGLAFHYTVSGNEILVDRKKNSKPIVRSSVNMSLKTVIEQKGAVSGPKALGIYGASYLYPVFRRFGLIST